MVHSFATIATRDPDDGGDGDEALASPSPEVDPQLGTCLLDRYRLEEVLGAGGSSVIYRGVHTTIGRTVAIKMLRPELVRNDETVTRFLREGRAACRIRHEHIVEATDFGVTPDGDVFLVMEYLEGEDLADLIEREGALAWPRARAIALQICEAIDAAHQAGVIHRDITLQNCFRVSRERNPDYVKVIDFGIAKMCDASAPSDEVGVTGNAEIFGTPEYMAPEQVRRTVDADARTDIYALGVVLYALVTGQLPLRGATALDTLVRQIYDAVEPPSRVVPGIPEELEAAILRALAKDPDARFQSMAELARALESVPVLGLVDEQQTDEIAIDQHALAGDRPITAYDLPSLADHDLRSETPAERLIGGSSRSWIGSRWSLAAMAACALVLVGLSAMDRESETPGPVAPSEIASAAVVPEPVAPRDVPAPVAVEAPVRVEPPTSTPTLRDHGIAVADVAPSRVRAPKPTRRSSRADAIGEAPLEDTTMRPSAAIAAPSVPLTPDAATAPSHDEPEAIAARPDDAPADDAVPSDDAAAVDAEAVEPETVEDAVEVPAPPAADDAEPSASTPDHTSEEPVGAPQ